MNRQARKIDKLVALAAADERRQGELTGRFRQLLYAETERLGELNAYRQGYASRQHGVDAIDSAHFKDFHKFLRRLDEALVAQQQVVENCERQLEAHRRRWMVKRQRLESLQRVVERYEAEDALRADRREQRVLDDRAPPVGPYARESED